MSQNRRRIKRSQPKTTDEGRYQLVAKVDRYREVYPDIPLDDTCHSCEVSPSNYRRWKAMLDDHPEYHEQGIIPAKSQRPNHLARQTSDTTKQRVVEEANKTHHTSASSITDQLKSDGIPIGKGKVIEILEEAGLYGTIYKTNATGEYKQRRGLLRLCEKRQQGA